MKLNLEKAIFRNNTEQLQNTKLKEMVKVNLYIYDISKGMARQLSLPLLGKQIDGVWHTGIVCFGKEYFFGSSGISNCAPCGTILGQPNETVCLGETSVTKKIFHEYLAGLSNEAFRGETYDLFQHNCNTFSNEVAQFLTGKNIPAYITDLPQEVMSTPFGAMISQFFENVRAQSSEEEPGSSLHLEDEEIFEGYPDVHPIDPPPQNDSSQVTSYNKTQYTSLLPATFPVELQKLEESVEYLKKNFEKYTKSLDKLHSILREIELDFRNEDELRKDVTETLTCLCKELQDATKAAKGSKAYKHLLVILQATALNLHNVFKYAEGDEIVLMVTNRLHRGLQNDVYLLRMHFINNLLSVYELRNHLMAIESMLKTLVSMAVSSVLDAPDPFIREAGCCLVYSLSIVKINDDHMFELSSALLHVVCELSYDSRARDYCVAAIKNFIEKNEQVAELAQMIVPDLYENDFA